MSSGFKGTHSGGRIVANRNGMVEARVEFFIRHEESETDVSNCTMSNFTMLCKKNQSAGSNRSWKAKDEYLQPFE